MTGEVAALLALAIPLGGAFLIATLRVSPNARETITLAAGALLLADVIFLVSDVSAGGRPAAEIAEVLPGIPIALAAEPLGALFAIIASGLWIVTSVYSIGYMRGNGEDHQTRFYACFALAIGATMGIALAGNLFTLFVFYEALTLSTYPLVTHHGDEEAKKAGRVYLGILISTSIGFFLFAILWTWYAAGTVEFREGGILSGAIQPALVPVLLALYAFGLGKAALMPFHRWLPAAMVAPTPVSALLHAVAVVKAGVFSILKIVVYVFGIDFLTETSASLWLAWAAAATILIASAVALSKDNLKARLAYSTISQLSYIVLGAALATRLSIIGGGLHIAMHALGKITLFFCAGAIYTAAHKTEISDMDGIGRVMPVTMTAFFLGALSIIGLPPLGGSWSKWYLALGAAEAHHQVFILVLMASSLLNVAYLMPPVVRGFFLPARGQPALASLDGEDPPRQKIMEAPLLCVLPLCLTAIGSLLLFFYADGVADLLKPVAGAGTLAVPIAQIDPGSLSTVSGG